MPLTDMKRDQAEILARNQARDLENPLLGERTEVRASVKHKLI